MSKILFYSPYCEFCIEFIKIFKQSQYHEDFQYIDVKKDKITKKRNPYVYKFGITEVPTIYVDGNLYSGKEAFLWLRQSMQIVGLHSMDTRIHGREDNKTHKTLPSKDDKIKKINIEEYTNKKPIKYEYIEDVKNHVIDTPDAEQMVHPETGKVIYAGKNNKKHYRKDELKKQQLDNEYSQLLREREELNKKLRSS
jgi:glutaredoxin